MNEAAPVRKDLHAILGRNRDADAVRAVFGARSEPFPTPTDGEIAVRLIIRTGSVLSWHGTSDRATTPR